MRTALAAEPIALLRQDQLPPTSPLGRLQARLDLPVDGPTLTQVQKLEGEAGELSRALALATIDTMSTEDFVIKSARLQLLKQTIPGMDRERRERDTLINRRREAFEAEWQRYQSLVRRLQDGTFANETSRAAEAYRQAMAMVTPAE